MEAPLFLLFFLLFSAQHNTSDENLVEYGDEKNIAILKQIWISLEKNEDDKKTRHSTQPGINCLIEIHSNPAENRIMST